MGDEAEGLGSGVGEVDDAVVGGGAVIIDGDADGFAVAEIGDAKFGAAGERAVGGSESGGGVDAAAGGFVSFEGGAVEGGVAVLGGMLVGMGAGLRWFGGLW